MALVWLPNIKKISSTNPANIRCLLIIKVGHIGANNLFPNVMQIENYLFSSYLPYIQKREYIDGMALPYVGGDPSIAKGGSLKVISGHLYFRLWFHLLSGRNSFLFCLWYREGQESRANSAPPFLVSPLAQYKSDDFSCFDIVIRHLDYFKPSLLHSARSTILSKEILKF